MKTCRRRLLNAPPPLHQLTTFEDVLVEIIPIPSQVHLEQGNLSIQNLHLNTDGPTKAEVTLRVNNLKAIDVVDTLVNKVVCASTDSLSIPLAPVAFASSQQPDRHLFLVVNVLVAQIGITPLANDIVFEGIVD